MIAAPPMSPAVQADEAVRAVLRSQYGGAAALRVDSPPGAGKTGIVERLAVQTMALQGERCMVATQTNEQAFDLARRLGAGFPRLVFTRFVRQDLQVPQSVSALPNVQIARNMKVSPVGACVVISNAAKWSWVDDLAPFDCQIVDEAFQLPDYWFHHIAGWPDQWCSSGQPGQIAPVGNL